MLGVTGFSSNADASVALCVGCTTDGQFQAAAWQAFGPGYTQNATLLVINPDTGLSQWVSLERIPAGGHVNVVKANAAAKSQKLIQPGVATGLPEDLPPSIYFADNKNVYNRGIVANNTTIQNAFSSSVTASEQVGINTAIEITKKTYFVQLNPRQFPSYAGSLQISIAMANWAALQQVPGVNWPVSVFSSTVFKSMLQLMGVYSGHSFLVCDVFANGDSACFVPDPQDNNILTQSGPAKDANGNPLNDITNRVPGGGGGGMGVRINPPSHIDYIGPSNASIVRCGYVNGELSICLMIN